jgi:phage-related protein
MSDKMKAFLEEILEAFKKAWELLGDDLIAEWEDLKESFKHFCDSLGKFLVSVWEHGGKEFVQHMAEIGLACAIAAMEIGGEILDSLARLWDHLDPAKNMNTQGFLDALNEVSVKLRDFILGLGDHFESFMANGGQDLLNAFGDLAMNIGEAIVRGFGVGIDALDGLIDHLDPANNPKTKKMLKTWEETFGSIGDMALDFVGLLESTLKNGGQEIINSLGDLGVGILDAAGIVIGEIAKTFSELFKHMDPEKNENSKNMLESFDKFIDSLNDFVDAIAKAFKKFMDSGGREFIKNLGDILAIVADLAFTLGGGIIDLITGFINSFVGQKLIEGVAKALEWFSDKLLGLKGAVQIIKDAFQDVIDIIVGIFEGDGEKVGRAFASLIKNALKLTGELVEWLVQLGMDLVAGLVKGICSLPKLLWEAVKFLFDTIVGFFKELFGIHSPSTVFADLGVNLIEGLIEGIKGMLGAVGDIFTNLKEAIVGWVQDIVGGAVEKWDELKEGITTNLGTLYETVSEKWKDIYENVTGNCKDIYDDASEKWKDIYEDVSGRCKDIYDDAKDKWDKVKDNVTDNCKNIYNDAKDKWDKTKENVTKNCKDIHNDAIDKWNKVKDNVTNNCKNIYNDAIDKWNKVKDNVTNNCKEIHNDAIDKWNKVKDNVTENCKNIYSDAIDKWDKVKENVTTNCKNIYNDAIDKWNKVKENVTTNCESIYTNAESSWGETKKKTLEYVGTIQSEVEQAYDSLKTHLGTVLDTVNEEAGIKWDAIKSTTNEWVGKVVSEATNIFGNIKQGFFDKIDNIKNTWGPKWETLKSSAKTNAESVVSSAKSGFSGLSGALTDAIDNAKNAASRAWKGVKDAFSKLEFSMPKIKLPKLKIEWETLGSNSSWFPSIKYPKLSWYARGGIIDGITPLGFANGSMHMAGEAGKEMVVPLENTSFTSKIAQAMGQAVDNAMARNMNGYYGSSYNVIDDKRDIVLKINDREFARASINSINKLQRESGRTLLDI